MLGLGVVVAAFLSAPTFAVWCLAFFNAKPAWREDDDAEGGMENDMMPELGDGFSAGCKILSDFAIAALSGERSGPYHR